MTGSLSPRPGLTKKYHRNGGIFLLNYGGTVNSNDKKFVNVRIFPSARVPAGHS